MHSAILQTVQELNQRKNLGSALFENATRALDRGEILKLESQGNFCESWDLVRVHPSFDGLRIHFNRFSGRVIIGQYSVGWGIYHSCLENSEVGNDALVDHCLLIRNTVVAGGVEVRGSSLDCSVPVTFGLGVEIKAGLETEGKEIPIWDSMTLDSAQTYLFNKDLQKEIGELLAGPVSHFSYVAAQSRIMGTVLADGVFVSEGSQIQGALRISNSALVGSLEEPINVGSGVIVEDSLMQWGVHVDGAAQIRRSVLLEYSSVGRGGLVTESLIGPNTAIAEGEVTACFLGPFIGFHHQSLLIASWWPEGRGNVGYGANIGSNHTSRAPDQEFYPGEGTFFGLASAVKFPSNFQDAPYTLLATGVKTLPQRLAMPFSLITDDPAEGEALSGLNRIIPGWIVKENLYSLLRNEQKYRSRNKAQRHQFDFRVVKPEITEKVWNAVQELEACTDKSVYTAKDSPGLGKNYLKETDRVDALTVYRRFLRFAGLKLYAEDFLGITPCDQDWLGAHFRRMLMDLDKCAENLEQYLDMERENWLLCMNSKRKDEVRGQKILPHYQEFHIPAEDDEFLKRRQEEIGELGLLVRKMCQKKA